MFTVKLTKGHSTKLVQAEEVNIYPCGLAQDSGNSPANRTNDVREVATRHGSETQAFFVADNNSPRPEGFADCVIFYDAAYIENERGATTEIVRPY